ncbi:MAG TPA: Dabb family protein [Blastocatellia bacterium]|nr:Dabb family protein [Blastocatellia bacterium]
MLVHTVYFWLDPNLTAEQVAGFEERLNKLTTISAVKYGFTGKPAATADRPVIDRSYSYGLTLIFDSVAKHDEYQVDPLHKDFVEHGHSLWTRVTIYDFE